MIGAICEQPLLNDACAWRGPVGKYLLKDGGAASTAASSRNGSRANSARGSSNIFGEAPTTISCTPIPSWSPNTLDMTSDDPSIFEAQIDALFRRVVEITRAKHVREYFEVPEPIPVPIQVSKPQPQFHKVHVPLPQSQGLPPHATREDAQFMQWMARCCPEISLEKRVVYCAAFEHRGVKTVHQLAECMRDETNYLMSAGVSERDADDIALAVSDLGLGYVPVRDFSNASTIESAVYAMRKSCEAAGDSELGANALACIARIARGDPENAPLALAAAGCVEPVVKILSRNLGFATCVANAYLALQGLSVNEEIAAKLGDVSACDVVPRALQSHLTNEVVVEQGCKLISMLAGNMENNFKLGTAGACDVVMKGLLKHINHPGVARWGCDAANKLAIGNFENVGKLSYHNACEALSTAVAVHFQVADVAEHAFRAMNILAVEPENRARMGKLGACEGTLNALNFHMNNPIIVEYALRLITVLIVGNSNNRNALGRLGATTLIFNVFSTYTSLKHRSQLKVKQTKQAPNNAIFGGSASASMQAVESPYVFDFPEIIEYASRATYSLAAGSPDNQRALMPVLPFLQDITRVANAYVEVANAVEMQTTGKRSAGNAHTNIVVPGKEEMLLSAETQAMRRIKNEATEGFQRVGSS